MELINWNPNFVFEFNFSLVAIAVQSCQRVLLLSLTMGTAQSAGAGLSATCLFQAEPHANQSHTQLTHCKTWNCGFHALFHVLLRLASMSD